MTTTEPRPVTEQAATRAQDVLREILSGGVVRTLLAVILAFVAGAVLIIVTNDDVVSSAGYFFSRPGDTLQAAWGAVVDGYGALFRGAVYNSNARSVEAAFRPLTETLRFAGPLIAAGLGVALSFRVGLFNIGGQGQLLVAAGAAGFVSFNVDLPIVVHLVVAIAAGLVAGAVWGGVVGFLKARTGAHEVIVTIMLNYIALYLISYLMRTPVLADPESGGNPRTPAPDATAQLPTLLGGGFDLHLGFLLAILAAVVFWWLMERSALGFRFRAVGLNSSAALTAGIDVNRIYVLALALSGAFVGLAGVNQALGRDAGFTPTIDSGIGFDAITVALLGGSRAGGVVLAGLLFGAMRAGTPAMQVADVSPEVLSVVQGLIVLFVAAPPLVRAIFRLPKTGEGGHVRSFWRARLAKKEVAG